ncbi:hypothetical protein BH10ACT1_BH10ACT1_16660 [soil metagenome]
MAVWMVARSLVRRRRRSLLGLAVVLAVLGGLGFGAIAGARRTQSAYPRFERWDRTSTIAVDTGDDLALLKEVEALPQVVSHRRYAALYVAPVDAAGSPDISQDFEALASMDGRYFDQDTFAPTEGRLPNPDRVDEIAVNRYAADQYGYHVGQQIDMGVFAAEEVEQAADGTGLTPKLRREVRVVGIGLFPEEVVQDESDRNALLLFTPAFELRADEWATYYWSGMILRHGDADVPAFKAAYQALLPEGYPEFYRLTAGITFHAQQAVRPLSIALALFGGAALAAGLVLTLLAVGREVAAAGDERLALRSLGLDRRQLVLATLLGPGLAVSAGTIGAMAVAVALSPTMPLGPVREVEVDPGVSFDWAVLGLGAALVLLVCGASAMAVAGRAQASDRGGVPVVERVSWSTSTATRLGLGVAAPLGLRLAFQPGRGRSLTTVRSVIAGCTLAIGCLTAALTFSASLDTLVHRPALYGWDWDATAIDGAGYTNMDPEVVSSVLGANPDVESWGGYNFGSGRVDGQSVPMLGAQPGASVQPPITEGRAPRDVDEVALGAATASQMDRSVGDTVRVDTDAGTKILRVVGIAVLPAIGVVHGDHTSLGTGIWLSKDHIPGIQRDVGNETAAGPNVVFIRFRAGVDHAAARRRLDEQRVDLDPASYAIEYLGVQRPGEIVNTSDLGSAPALLASVLIVGSAVALASMLSGSVRRERRDLAVFRVLGGSSRQLRSTVLWQSTATVVVGTVIGVPLGLAAGRVAWTRFAEQLQVVPHPDVPVAAIGVLVVAAVVVANVVAIGPGIVASRTPSALALRAE